MVQLRQPKSPSSSGKAAGPQHFNSRRSPSASSSSCMAADTENSLSVWPATRTGTATSSRPRPRFSLTRSLVVTQVQRGRMFVANQMDQPGQINRTFFRSCLGVGEGLFTLADPVKNVVGGVRTRLNRKFRGFQWIIDVVSFGVVVWALPAAQSSSKHLSCRLMLRPPRRTGYPKPGLSDINGLRYGPTPESVSNFFTAKL